MNIFIDVESVPCQDPARVEELAAALKPPSNYSKPEAIAKWKANAEKELRSKTALDPYAGELVCISFAVEENEIKTVAREVDEPEPDYLRRFLAELETEVRAYVANRNWAIEHAFSDCNFVGYYCRFDLAYIHLGLVMNELQSVFDFSPMEPEWRARNYTCVHHIASFGGFLKTGGLKNLARAFNFDPLEMPVEEIEADWKSGNMARVIAYNRSDVAMTIVLYHKLTGY